MNAVKNVSGQVAVVAKQLETHSADALVAGFSFATAIAWMDVVRFIISSLVKVKANGGAHYLLTALLTTLLSILVFMIISKVSKKVVKPQAPVYAVTA